MLTTLDLDAIEARAAAATEGPWEAEPHDPEDGEWIVWLNGYQDEAPLLDSSLLMEPDATFIAHARTDIPALIAEVRRLTEEHDELMRHKRFLFDVIDMAWPHVPERERSELLVIALRQAGHEVKP